MSRFPHFGALLGLAALLSAPVLAQTSGQTSAATAAPANKEIRSDSTAAKGAHVEQVLVHAADTADAALSVEIQTSGARVAPDTQVITDPDRIVVDFPGALPAAALHALTVNKGPLKGIRTGLFFNDPPITRVVLDLAEPQSYQISTSGNRIVVRLSPGKVTSSKVEPANKVEPAKTNQAAINPVTPSPVGANAVKLNPVKSSPVKSNQAKSNQAKSNQAKSNQAKSNPVTLNSVKSNPASGIKLNSATLNLDLGPGVVIERYPIAAGGRAPVAAAEPATRRAPSTEMADPRPVFPSAVPPPVVSPRSSVPVIPSVPVAAANVPPVVTAAVSAPLLEPIAEESAPSRPLVSVNFANGLLSIRAEKATLAQVLYEVQRQTQAEIAIPAGAEQEEVVANIAPATARDALASLLNGSSYNFIFVGSQDRLERVILTLRDPNIF